MVVTNHSANNDIICYIYPILSDCVGLKRLHSIIDINSIIHKGRVKKNQKSVEFSIPTAGRRGRSRFVHFPHFFIFFFS